MAVGAKVAHDAHAAGIGKHRKALPELPVQAGGPYLVHDYPVAGAEHLQLLPRDLADDTDGQAGAGEGLAVNHLLRKSQSQTHLPHLILKEVAKRLHQGEGHILRKAAHVVVGLDLGRRLVLRRLALYDIGVEGALGQEVDSAQDGRLFLKDAYELLADGDPLLLRVDHPGQARQEVLRGVHADYVHIQVALEGLHHTLGLLFPKKAVVDEDAG